MALNEPCRAVTEACDIVDHHSSEAFHRIIDEVESPYGEGSAAAKRGETYVLRSAEYLSLLDRLRGASSTHRQGWPPGHPEGTRSGLDGQQVPGHRTARPARTREAVDAVLGRAAAADEEAAR